MAKHKSDGAQNGEFRDHLAKRIVSWSIIAVVLFGLLALAVPVGFSLLGLISPRPDLSSADKAAETAFGIFTMLGPMMAGWVGVVIGYYFANKAHQDASNNTQKLLERMSPSERLRSSTMKRAMRLLPLIDTSSVSSATARAPDHQPADRCAGHRPAEEPHARAAGGDAWRTARSAWCRCCTKARFTISCIASLQEGIHARQS